MRNINRNELTPARYTITGANDVDLGIGDSVIQNNTRYSKAVGIGAENLSVAFRPDWDVLGADADLAEENDTFSVRVKERQANVKTLTTLWSARDYQDVVELMESAADPGPIDGEKSEDHE